MKAKFTLILSMVLFIPGVMFGQSLYSSVGFGELTIPGTIRTAGMGSAGIAVRDMNEVSLINPAHWYTAELTGLTTKIYSNQYINGGNVVSSRLAFDAFNFHFPIGSKMGVALGFSPYSYMGYHYQREGLQSSISDSIIYSLEQSGDGGVGGYFLGFGLKLNDHLSVGSAVSLLVGQLRIDRILRITQPTDFYNRKVENSSNLSGTNIIFGASYQHLFSKNDNLSVRGEIPLGLVVNRDITYYTGSTTSTRAHARLTNMKWPLQLGAGYSTPVTGRWLAMAEAYYWDPQTTQLSIDYTGQNTFTQDKGYQLSVGVEYSSIPDADDWWNRVALRTGLSWRRYLITDDAGDHAYGMKWSGGFGFPFGGGANRLDVSVFYGQRTGLSTSNLSEQLMGFQVGITVGELWFHSGRRPN